MQEIQIIYKKASFINTISDLFELHVFKIITIILISKYLYTG